MKPPASALVVVTRRLGDVLLATPVVRSLKRAYPECRVDALVFAGTESALVGNPDLHRVLTVAERPGVPAHGRLAARIFRRYDLALSLVASDRPTAYAALAGKLSAGLAIATAKHAWKRWVLDRWVPFDDLDTHTVIMHLRLVETLGIPPVAEVVAPARPEEARAVLSRHGVGEPYAVLHPHPKFRYKRWHDDGWLETAHWLTRRGLRVLLTGGPDPEERAHCEALAARTGAISLAGALSLPATASVIARAAAYVGPDTVTTHMAAALGVPTIALFGPSNPVKWGPWPHARRELENPWRRVGSQARGNVHLVQGEAPCVPCGQEGCERRLESRADCLSWLSARRVIAALEQSLAAAPRAPRAPTAA
jgi:heptosyltransferase-3